MVEHQTHSSRNEEGRAYTISNCQEGPHGWSIQLSPKPPPTLQYCPTSVPSKSDYCTKLANCAADIKCPSHVSADASEQTHICHISALASCTPLCYSPHEGYIHKPADQAKLLFILMHITVGRGCAWYKYCWCKSCTNVIPCVLASALLYLAAVLNIHDTQSNLYLP